MKTGKVAIIGAGPGGFYAALELLKQPRIHIDIFDQLPTPFGLVRYGIAPDNQRMKTVSKVFSRMFDEHNRLRFIGNVHFGTDLLRNDLLDHYDSVIYATGATDIRALGVTGENLAGCFTAKDFVDWYNGHPHRTFRNFSLDFSAVAVVGGGNVALDVARMLANDLDVVRSTDVPDDVLESFEHNTVKDIHLLVRRGPAQAKFTPVELRGLGKLKNVDIIVDPEDLVLTEDELVYMDGNQQCRTNIDIFKSFSQRPAYAKNRRRLFIKFWYSVDSIGGESKVQWLTMHNNKHSVGHAQGIAPRGEPETLSIDAVFTAIGNLGTRLQGVPFDERQSVIPNNKGNITDQDGRTFPREYVSGWAKRGPTGTVGTNREDSKQTVSSLLNDWERPVDDCSPRHWTVDITELLGQRNVRFTCWQDWLWIDAAETKAGEEQGRIRAKVSNLSDMMRCLENNGTSDAVP